MKKIAPFIGFWVVNSLLIYLANQNWPANFVLGNARLSPTIAMVLAGLVITVAVVVASFIKMALNKAVPALEGLILTLIYFAFANFVAIWVTARMAEVFGLGISRFTFVIGLAVVADLAQWLVWSILGDKGAMSPKKKPADDEVGEEEDEED